MAPICVTPGFTDLDRGCGNVERRERERGQQRATEWGGDGTRILGIWNSAEHCLELECEEEKTRLAVDRVKP